MTPFNIAGINSGFDTNAMITALMNIERQGLTRLTSRKSLLEKRQSAYRDLESKLSALRSAAKPLADFTTALAAKATAADETLLKASATGTAAPGTYQVTILQKASSSVLNGTSDAGRTIDPNVALNHANAFGSTFAEGQFTINGIQIAVSAGDTLNNVLANITAAMGGGSKFSAKYDAAADKVTLAFKKPGDGPLILGSAADSSNLLSMLRLTADGVTSSATSMTALGRLDLLAKINDGGANGARARTAINDGGAGAGEFKINGISIGFVASIDTLSDVIKRINQSDAGVTAAYDAFQDRIVLTNREGGAVGIFAADVTGNLIGALGLGGSAALGQNGRISIDGVNGGAPIVSADNIFTEAETGIAGLSITVKAESGSTTIDVTADRDAMKEKVQEFVDAYNNLVKFIQDESKITGTGLTAITGPLHGEQGVWNLARTLRSMVAGVVPGPSGGPISMEGLGISTTGSDPNLQFDAAKFDEALQNHPDSLKAIFADSADGIMSKVVAYVDAQTLFGEGPIATKPATIDPAILRINASIERFNRNLTLKEAQLRRRFEAMERAIGQLGTGASAILASLGTP